METIPGYLERLPDGRDRGRAEMLAREPRERILVAMYELVAKRGYSGTSVEHIVKRAGISRATFYEHFGNREDCLLAGFADAEAELHHRTTQASQSGEWPQRVSAALSAFVEYCTAEPAVARTCLVEFVTAGPIAMECYERALQGFTPLLREGRSHTDSAAELPDDLEDLIIGGLAWMVHQRLRSNEIGEIAGLLPTMLAFALLPYSLAG